MSEPRRYRFGPPESAGPIGGLRWGQLALVAAGLLGMILVLHSAGPAVIRSQAGIAVGALALAFALAGAAAAFVPLRGRPLEAWGPLVAGFWRRRLWGRGAYRSHARLAGRTPGGDPVLELPAALSGLRIVGVPSPVGEMGLARQEPGPTWTLVVVARAGAFALLDDGEKERRLSAFGAAIAGLARAESPLRRVQWVERTAVQPVDELGEHLAAARDPGLPLEHVSLRSYIGVVDAAAPAAQAHEVLIALQVDARRAARAIARRGGGERGALALLLEQARALDRALGQADVRVEGALTPRMLARAIRSGYTPDPRLRVRGGAGVGEGEGTDARLAAPQAADEGWGHYRTDGYVHRTYWCAQWPRIDVSCDVLQPLLLGPAARRAVSVVIEPLDPRRAIRQVENARTNELADDDVRQRAGFRLTARRRRQQEALARREQEIADGHAACRFSGYVTVSGRSLEELEAACAEVEECAGRSHIELEPCVGEQAEAFTYTLPLCRGLR